MLLGMINTLNTLARSQLPQYHVTSIYLRVKSFVKPSQLDSVLCLLLSDPQVGKGSLQVTY